MTLHKEAEFSRLSGGESSDGFMIGLSRENGHSDRIRRAISVVVRHVVGAEDVPGQRQPDVRTMTCETEDGLAGDAGRELGLLIPRRRRGGGGGGGARMPDSAWSLGPQCSLVADGHKVGLPRAASPGARRPWASTATPGKELFTS